MPVDALSHVCLKRNNVRHDKYKGLYYVPALNLSIIFIHTRQLICTWPQAFQSYFTPPLSVSVSLFIGLLKVIESFNGLEAFRK